MIEEMYLIILSAVVVILVIALVILSYKVFSLQNSLREKNKKETTDKTVKTAPEMKRVDREDQKRPKISSDNQPARPEHAIRPDINLTDGVNDINESMNRFAQKYILDSATLASTDGFSLASSHTNSEQEAANLAARYQENAITEIGDTHIIPIQYQGEEILILIRTTTPIHQEQATMMKRDGEMILTKWL